jgi:Putative restriction endonuclease
MSSDVSRTGLGLPAIDERLVAPDTRYEIYDGELVYVPPADPPHGTRHVQIAALVEIHAGPEFEVAADMLTRTSKIDDIAPDVSVYPEAPDPGAGGRQLEQLAFEIVSTESLGRAGRKAAKLSGRGVRRVFAIDVEQSRALEWSVALGAWCELDAAGHIDDPALAVPLPVDSMIHAARADDAVARALLAKRNPVLEVVRASDRAEGRAEALIAILAARGLSLDHAVRARILGERDLARLDRWIARALAGATTGELFTEP